MAGYGDGHLPSQRDALVRQHNERGICLPEGRGSGRLSFVGVLSLLFGARRRRPFCDCPSPIGGVFGGSHHDEEIADAFIAAAYEAMAQDAQCVLERAAMVETIRAYARPEAGVLGPQGISERVLEAMGKRNAIGSSPVVLARWHTRTGRFS